MQNRVEAVESNALRTDLETFDLETERVGAFGNSRQQALVVANGVSGTIRTRSTVAGFTRGEPRSASETVVRERPSERASVRRVGAAMSTLRFVARRLLQRKFGQSEFSHDRVQSLKLSLSRSSGVREREG